MNILAKQKIVLEFKEKIWLGNTLPQRNFEGYHLISPNTSNTFVYVRLVCSFRYWFCAIISPSRWQKV